MSSNKIIDNMIEKFKEDPIKTINTAGATVLVGFAAYNRIRASLMRSKSNREVIDITNHDFMVKKLSKGTIEDKMAVVSFNNSMITTGVDDRYSNPNDENTRIRNEVVAEIAKKRNGVFKSLTRDQQYEILRMEGFNFREYLMREHFPDMYKRKIGEKPEGTTKEAVDYGVFNFIAKPLDSFILWLKDDPTPAEDTPQIDLVEREEVPQLSPKSIAQLNSIHRDNNTQTQYFPKVKAEDAIAAEEVFRHKTLGDFRKAVAQRMLPNGFKAEDLYSLIKQDMKAEKKEKKHSDRDDWDDDEGVKSKKKKKKNKNDEDFWKTKKVKPSKEDKSIRERAEREIQEDRDKLTQMILKGQNGSPSSYKI